LQMNTHTGFDVPNYSKIMGAILGNLSPYIYFAQPEEHDDCIQIVIRVLIPIIAIVLAMAFPPALGLTLGANIGADLLAGFAAGCLDAMGQGVAISFGVFQHFSWTEVLETAAAAAMQGYLKGTDFGKEIEAFKRGKKVEDITGSVMKMAAAQAALNTSLQLTEMAVGVRKKFDIKMLVSVMAASIVDAGMGSMLPKPAANDYFLEEVEQKCTDFVDDIMGDAIMGGHLDFKTLLAQELGSTIGEVAGMYVQHEESKHKAPHVEKTRTKVDDAYVHAHANGKSLSEENSYMLNSPDVGKETTSNKYTASVYTSGNKSVTSTNRHLDSRMDLDNTGQSWSMNSWERKLKMGDSFLLGVECLTGGGINFNEGKLIGAYDTLAGLYNMGLKYSPAMSALHAWKPNWYNAIAHKLSAPIIRPQGAAQRMGMELTDVSLAFLPLGDIGKGLELPSFLGKAGAYASEHLPFVEKIGQATERSLDYVGSGIKRAGKFAKNRFGFWKGEKLPQLFENQFPEGEIGTPNIIPNKMLSEINGRFNYVVDKAGELIVGRKGEYIGHIDLIGGSEVQAAGEIKVVNGQIKYIDNSSGHYLPTGKEAQQVAENAFEKLGFDTVGKYIEKAWIDEPTLPRGGTWRSVP
jgi:hypothetical protein